MCLEMAEKLQESESEREKLRVEVVKLRAENTCLKEKGKMVESFYSKTNGRVRKQGGTSLAWSDQMRLTCLRLVSRGMESVSVQRCLKYISEGMGLSVNTPSLTVINDWRSKELPIHCRDQVSKFVNQAQSLTLCLDCASYCSWKISGCYFVSKKPPKNYFKALQ